MNINLDAFKDLFRGCTHPYLLMGLLGLNLLAGLRSSADPFPATPATAALNAVSVASTANRPKSSLVAPPQPNAPKFDPKLFDPDVPYAGLSFVPDAATPRTFINQATHPFGTQNPLDTPQVEAVFRLKNDTAQPLTILRLSTSCPCTKAELLPRPRSGALPVIAPGAQIALRVTLDLAGHPGGPLANSVDVYIQGQSRPAAELWMKGSLTPLVSITPPLLDFGTVPAGQTPAQTITVTVDSRLAPGGVLPVLRSTAPALRLTPLPSPPTDPTGKGQGARTLTRCYTVTLDPNAPLGPVSGMLMFVPPAETSDAAAQAFTGASVLLLGQVQGAVSAAPQTLAFGTVRLGEESIRMIGLTGTSSAAIQDIQVASASPWVSAALEPTTPTFGAGGQLLPGSRTLRVTLSRQTPPGAVRTQLKVSLAGGRRLLIPVTAYVSDLIGF